MVLYYLNEDNSVFIANYVFKYIADKENGFVTFFIKDKILNHMINNVIEQGGNPPKNKIRKVIFKDNSGLNINKKLSIVGQLVGRKKITEEQIYEYMLDLAHVNKKITIKLLADLLKCSSRTVHRNMSKELKHEKQKLNEKI